MKYNYEIYTTNDEYDVGGCFVPVAHGFEIEIDDNNCININSLNGYGDFSYMAKEIKNLKQLKSFIKRVKKKYNKYVDCFDEIVSFINNQSKIERG